MESGLAFDDAGLVGKSHALLGNDRIQFFDRIDVLVDNGLIDKDPQRFCRLQFRRVGRQKNQPYAFRDIQSRLGMPAGIIENKHDGPVHTRASFAREHLNTLSISSKNGFDTPLEIYQKDSPVAGETKAVT
jgi:hypothetical protein